MQDPSAPRAAVSRSPLLVFDFDGVLVDGMAEYWWAARQAVLLLAPDLLLPEQAPPGFAALRPLIHKGWEMVLMAAELARPQLDLQALLAGYAQALPAALARWGWTAPQLQRTLEQVRSGAIATDLQAWLALHRFYPGVEARLRQFGAEGADWVVLTTKGAAFARQILAGANLQPRALFGHEQGSKPEVLARLLGEGRPLWFVEDRRPTLEQVRSQPLLDPVRCYLVTWGYLGPADGLNLPAGIRRLTPEQFAAPLATWP